MRKERYERIAIFICVIVGGLTTVTARNTMPDQEFVTALGTLPTGIYYRDVARFSSEKVETEFRDAAARPELLANEDFMANVLFLIRKREILTLHDDVARLIGPGTLKPRASVSALKTLIAIGNRSDLSAVDRSFSDLLKEALKNPRIEADVLPWAERVGGPETLSLMSKALESTTKEQRAAERASPPDFARISQLDRVRSSLENQYSVLQRKLELDALSDSQRALPLTQLYMSRNGHLAVWSFKQLVDHPSPASAAGVRAFMSDPVQAMVPKSTVGEARSQLILDLRLRGLCLLKTMGQATPQEMDFIEQNKARIEQNSAFYEPAYDWENVLDAV